MFFSDNASSPSERIWKVAVPPATTPSIFIATSGSNGLAVDNNDQIVAAVQRARTASRVVNPSPGMSGATIATTGKPNDVIVRSDDNMLLHRSRQRLLPDLADGHGQRGDEVHEQGSRPNGIELSTDENTLYVGDVGNRTIVKYTLAADGTVMTGTGALFVRRRCTNGRRHVRRLRRQRLRGHLGGVEVYSPAGTYIGPVHTGESSNCTVRAAPTARRCT